MYSLKVDKIVRETDDAATICFKQPALKKVKYVSGQYITLIFRINGRRYMRPYSFSSAPGVDSTINVTVKRVVGGVVSNHILDKVSIGDIIEVTAPMGDFVLPDDPDTLKNKHLVLWGSGSGITPLISIAKSALSQGICQHVTLVYGNRNFDTVIFADEISKLESTYSDSFSVWYFYTQMYIQESSSPYIVKGRIAPKKILDVMQQEGRLEHTLHYICGPSGLKYSVKDTLLELGVTKDKVFSEDFEIIRDPKDFADIFTQKVTLNLNHQAETFEVAKGKSILEAGLDSMLELSYSCQTGSCLLCKATLDSGQVKTIGVEKLPDELQTNECLLCCSFPVSADVRLSITN